MSRLSSEPQLSPHVSETVSVTPAPADAEAEEPVHEEQ